MLIAIASLLVLPAVGRAAPVASYTTAGCSGEPLWHMAVDIYFQNGAGGVLDRTTKLPDILSQLSQFVDEVGQLSACGVGISADAYDMGAAAWTYPIESFPTSTDPATGYDVTGYVYPEYGTEQYVGLSDLVDFLLPADPTVGGQPYLTTFIHEWMHSVQAFYSSANWPPDNGPPGDDDAIEQQCYWGYCSGTDAYDNTLDYDGALMTGQLGAQHYGMQPAQWAYWGTPRHPDHQASAPSATISVPASGATYAQGQNVTASYTCSEGVNGPGIVACDGTVPDGAPLDTSAPGAWTFEVDATSRDGQHATATLTYKVVAAKATEPKAGVSAPLRVLMTTSRVFVSDGRAWIGVACVGGRTDSRCEGTLSQSMRVTQRVRRRVHGHLHAVAVTKTVVLDRTGYNLPSGARRTLTMRLENGALGRLERAQGQRLRVRQTATLKGGRTTTRTAILQLANKPG